MIYRQGNPLDVRGAARAAARAALVLLVGLTGCRSSFEHRVATERVVVSGDDRVAVARMVALVEEHLPAVRELLIDARTERVRIELGDPYRHGGYSGVTLERVPFGGQWIVLPPDAPASVLVHELVHLVHGPAWKRLPGALEEGLAEWIAFRCVPAAADRATRLRAACGREPRKHELTWRDARDPERERSAWWMERTPVPSEPLSIAELLDLGQHGMDRCEHMYDIQRAYGLGFALVERIEREHGLAGLLELCRRAAREGHPIVPVEDVLRAAGFASIAELESWLAERCTSWTASDALLSSVSGVLGRSAVPLDDLSLEEFTRLDPCLSVDGSDPIPLREIEGFEVWARETFGSSE